MNLPVRNLRVLLSLMLAVSVTSLFTLRVYATSEPKAAASESMVVQDCTGTLTVKSGSVTLNGNAAQTGASSSISERSEKSSLAITRPCHLTALAERFMGGRPAAAKYASKTAPARLM